MTDELKAPSATRDGDGVGEDREEGEITFRVGHNEAGGTVLVEFDKPLVWLGMPAKVARQLAALLTKHADAVEGETVAAGEADCG